MNKTKFLIIAFLMFILVGCGAKFQYKTIIDTSKQTIKINIDMSIMEEDYQYINGGREAFVSIIKETKPKEMQFSIDENNSNLYKFELFFANFEEYQLKYKEITNEDSINIFSITNFTNESPFKASQEIQINDNIRNLMNWLKDELINKGIVSSEYVDRLVNTENSSYYFNDKISYDKKYFSERKINILENTVNLIVKKKNKIDLNLSLLILGEDNHEFAEPFKNFIANSGIDIKLNEVVTIYNDKECVQYDLMVSNIDASLEDYIKEVNNVFGQNFLMLNSRIIDEKSFFQTKYIQYIDIKVNMRNMFDLNEIYAGKINIKAEGVRIDNEPEGSLDQSITSNKSLYQFSFQTRYKNLHYVTTIIILIVIILTLYTHKKHYKNKFKIIKIKYYYKKIKEYIFNSMYVTKIEIRDSIIIGNDFTILVNNIVKTNYGKSTEILKYMEIFLFPVGLGLMFYLANIRWLAYIIFTCIIISTFVVVKIFFKYNAIELELSSGKKYYFVLGDAENTKLKYEELVENINNKTINKEIFMKKILEKSGENVI